MEETGRIIHSRYLLQRLIKHGQACEVYQGFDQVLQRTVTVKVAPAEQILAYRAAIRATSQFAHPNIIGLYDLIVEPETLYIVQEYVDGDDFATLLQSQLSPYYVVDLGIQICQALLYASTPARKVCHGDLTPTAILRDRSGLVRINNFALTTDMYYFTAWSVVGGNGIVISDPELPLGQMNDGRKDDDVRALGILLYQLLAGRAQDAVSVEPPTGGRLRFLRNVPPELCDVVARAIVRQHPQHLSTADMLLAELKVLAGKLDPVVAEAPAPAYQQSEKTTGAQYAPTFTGKLPAPASSPLRDRTGNEPGAGRLETNTRVAAMETATTVEERSSLNMASARPIDYSLAELPARRISLPLLLLVGVVLFVLFFAIGYFVAHSIAL